PTLPARPPVAFAANSAVGGGAAGVFPPQHLVCAGSAHVRLPRLLCSADGCGAWPAPLGRRAALPRRADPGPLPGLPDLSALDRHLRLVARRLVAPGAPSLAPAAVAPGLGGGLAALRAVVDLLQPLAANLLARPLDVRPRAQRAGG